MPSPILIDSMLIVVVVDVENRNGVVLDVISLYSNLLIRGSDFCLSLTHEPANCLLFV